MWASLGPDDEGASAGLTARTDAWRTAGRLVAVHGYRIFVTETPGDGDPLFLLHGYPSSSYDWRRVRERLPGHRLIAFDFLGFGLSDKPRQHIYSLLEQADIVEEIVGQADPREPVQLVAHDMGTSVVTELLARDLEGRLSFRLGDVLLFNGSMVLERASLSAGQKILRSRLGPLAAQLTNERSFRHSFKEVFSARHPLSEQEAADQWALLRYHEGHRILDRLIYYLHERVAFADRWHGALRDWPGRLELCWAELDPIATTAVLEAVLELRPHAPTVRLPEVGHYAQIEDPDAVSAAIAAFARPPARTSEAR